MTTINPTVPVTASATTTTTKAPAFKGGKDKIAESLAKKIIPQKVLTPEEAFMEKVAGMSCAANTQDKAVLKEIVLRETLLGNMDFVKGINEYLANSAAKNTYKK